MKILVFGTGKYCQHYKKFLALKDIVAYLDNDCAKHGKNIDGIPILSPEEGIKKTHDRIYILSASRREIKAQLILMGIRENVIYYTYDLGDIYIKKDIKIYGNIIFNQKKDCINDEGKKSILLISHSMELSGASIVLFYLAKVLKQNGYFVVVAGESAGDLISHLLVWDIPVIIDETLMIRRLTEFTWIKNFKKIFINTAVLSHLLLGKKINTPIIWWLHESRECYTSLICDQISAIQQDDLAVYAVHDEGKKIYNSYTHSSISQDLFYGIPDHYNIKLEKETNLKPIFAMIGVLEKRKAQDIFLKAINLVGYVYRQKAEFLIVGDCEHDELFAKKIIEEAAIYPEVKVTGKCNRKGIDDIYKKITILVCPSLDDPMPVVVTESMMMHKPCIVSNLSGQAKFIEPKKNGLICIAGDALDLADKIKWVIDNPIQCVNMGIESRKIYDEFFSINVFEKNVLKIFAER
jgi:glycosyltransferase involved in cell wall biosynthesis